MSFETLTKVDQLTEIVRTRPGLRVVFRYAFKKNGMVWWGGKYMMTSEFINEEISMLFCSKKVFWWVVGGWVVVVWSDYRVNLQVQT